MTLTIYFTNYPQKVSGDTLRLAQRLLPVYIQEKAVKFIRWQNAYACIFKIPIPWTLSKWKPLYNVYK